MNRQGNSFTMLTSSLGSTELSFTRRVATLVALLALLSSLIMPARSLQTSALAHRYALGPGASPATPPGPESVPTQAQEAYGKTPIQFEANHGQTDARVNFITHASGATVFLTATEAVFVLSAPEETTARTEQGNLYSMSKRDAAPRPRKMHALRMTIEGANSSPQVAGLDQLPGIVNYFIGNDQAKWHANIPTFARVHYAGVYEGVDLVYYGNQQQLEYDFVVAPGKDYSQIALNFEGANALTVDAGGDLLVETSVGTLRQRRPLVYQEVGGARREVESGYEMRGGGHVGFRVGAYDASRALIIDPVLAYSTYLGGNDFDSVHGIAVDSAGNAYVTGQTNSTDFPTTPGAFDINDNPGFDAFVTKLNASGTALVYSTYLGGNTNGDIGLSIAVDSAGNAYVTGRTDSTDFPTTPGAFDITANADGDAYVTKLNPAGSALVYSTYLGGGNPETGNGIAVDSAGNAYVVGETGSGTFPTTPGAFDTTDNLGLEVFVTKLAASGSTLVYSTYLGGNSDDEGKGIAVDSAGNAFVTGHTDGTFPTTPGAFDTTNNPSRDVFVTKVNASGSALVYSTYLGGDSGENCAGIAVDSAGNAYVVGATISTDFPTTPGAFQTTLESTGIADAFVTKFNSAGTALGYSTYLGGNDGDSGRGIALDSAGNAYVTGGTDSTNFPTTPGAPDTTDNPDGDAFVTKLNASGSALAYSTYLGGNGDERGSCIAVDSAGNAYVAGSTESTNFPTTPGAFQTGGGGFNGATSTDAFITKIGDFAITGRVIDSSGNGIADIAITLSGSTSGSTTTDANGNFLFLDTTPGGNFTVTPFEAGFTFSPESIIINDLNSNQELLFIGSATGTPTPTPTPVVTPTPTFTISGQVINSSGGAGIEGVTLTLNGSQMGTTQSNASGGYSFTVQGGGNYTVFPSESGFSFNPPSQSFSNLNSNAFADFIGTATGTPTPTPTPTATPTPTPAIMQFSAASFAVDEGAGQFQVIVTRSGDTSSAVSVNYETTDGTANDRGDYTTALGTLHFAAGDTAESFEVFITNDVFAEGNETINLALNGPSSGGTLGTQSSVVLTIVDDDLVNGSTNPIDSTEFFVRQHYIDFLNREPDAGGLAFWVNNIESCGADQECRAAKRIDTSAAFFLSIEFQQTGFLVHRATRAAFNRLPRYREFLRDTQQIGAGVVVGLGSWQSELEQNKQEYFNELVARAEFVSLYSGLTNEQYVDALNANTGASLSQAERDALVNGLNAMTETRASVLRQVVEDADLVAREFNPAFVLMEYFGYLRRNPDDAPDTNFAGFDFWLAKLNEFNGDFRAAELVKAFLASIEYRQRFAP